MREILERGVERIYPSADFLEKRLASGDTLRVYLGIDPTGPTLHVGHLIPLLKLRDFQKAGHRVTLLVGDFTAQIGDPTDKLSVRKKVTHAEVLHNARLYREQAGRLISFEGEHAADIVYNSKWLSALSFADVLDLSARLTYADLIKRDMFQKRIAEGKELYLHEFLYPLMQGYDSVAMDVDGEVGGNDQTFNMLVGRDLLKKIKGKEKFVVAMKLLADGEGKKMGKTEGNMVAFSDAPGECFGKVMSWPDDMILRGFELCTRVPLADIPHGGNPKNAKLRLAEEITALIHGASTAREARAGWEATFSDGTPQTFVDIPCAGAAEALIRQKIVASKTELRRLVAEGAVTRVGDGEKVGEDFLKNPTVGEYRIGKHRFVRITL